MLLGLLLMVTSGVAQVRESWIPILAKMDYNRSIGDKDVLVIADLGGATTCVTLIARDTVAVSQLEAALRRSVPPGSHLVTTHEPRFVGVQWFRNEASPLRMSATQSVSLEPTRLALIGDHFNPIVTVNTFPYSKSQVNGKPVVNPMELVNPKIPLGTISTTVSADPALVAVSLLFLLLPFAVLIFVAVRTVRLLEDQASRTDERVAEARKVQTVGGWSLVALNVLGCILSTVTFGLAPIIHLATGTFGSQSMGLMTSAVPGLLSLIAWATLKNRLNWQLASKLEIFECLNDVEVTRSYQPNLAYRRLTLSIVLFGYCAIAFPFLVPWDEVRSASILFVLQGFVLIGSSQQLASALFIPVFKTPLAGEPTQGEEPLVAALEPLLRTTKRCLTTVIWKTHTGAIIAKPTWTWSTLTFQTGPKEELTIDEMVFAACLSFEPRRAFVLVIHLISFPALYFAFLNSWSLLTLFVVVIQAVAVFAGGNESGSFNMPTDISRALKITKNPEAAKSYLEKYDRARSVPASYGPRYSSWDAFLKQYPNFDISPLQREPSLLAAPSADKA